MIDNLFQNRNLRDSSSKWANWMSRLSAPSCQYCVENHGKMIGGNVYHNKEKKLPDISGRVWYEADINYTEGFRNRQRILYSNDGLIFVTYDHYQTFYEITY